MCLTSRLRRCEVASSPSAAELRCAGTADEPAVDLNELVQDTVALIGFRSPRRPSVAAAGRSTRDRGRRSRATEAADHEPVINASDALADKVGRITIEIAHAHVTASETEGSPVLAELPAGRAVMLRVCDTGHGMSAEVQKRIYEPFFTTKITGRGLGLASVLNVVRGHRGAIRVESAPGSGTAFSVWLKRCDEQPSQRVPAPERSSAPASRGLARVVDDEPMLRDAAREVLQMQGFRVVVAEDGERALQRFAEHADELTLVLLDLTMPKLSGVEALRRMRERSPSLPVICASGYSAELVASEIKVDPATRFLAKPYSLTELMAAIDALLDP